jgi:hypothetical protein
VARGPVSTGEGTRWLCRVQHPHACRPPTLGDWPVALERRHTIACAGELRIPVFRLMLERGYLLAELFSSPLGGTELRGE